MNECAVNGSQRIITVAGCKGGVGKSIVASSLALEMGGQGKDVILVDADLGGPNLHTYLGIQAPDCVISDFLSKQVKTIDEIVLKTDFDGVRFISSAGNVPSQANLKFSQKAKIIRSILSLQAEIIIIDIGAGSSYDVMDFFSITENGILVTTPEPTSIVNSYGFLKNVLYRRLSMVYRKYSRMMETLKRGMNPGCDDGISAIPELIEELEKVHPEFVPEIKGMLSDFRPNIIVNMVSSEEENLLGEKLRAIARKHLCMDANCLGEVTIDETVRKAAKRMTPVMIFDPGCAAAKCIRKIAKRLLESGADLVEYESLEMSPTQLGASSAHVY